MMLSRLVLGASPIISASVGRKALQNITIRNPVCRQFQRNRSENTFRTRSERITERQQTLKERAMAPPGANGYFQFTQLQ